MGIRLIVITMDVEAVVVETLIHRRGRRSPDPVEEVECTYFRRPISMYSEILDDNGSVVNIIVADLAFLEAHYPGRWRQLESSPERPSLIVTSIDSDPAWGMVVNDDITDVTLPAGSNITVFAKLINPANNEITPLDGTFRMPIKSRDGREFIVLVGMQQGIAVTNIPFRSSGVWVATEASINSGLPQELHMSFKGITIYVVET
jgi:hypothetical protein